MNALSQALKKIGYVDKALCPYCGTEVKKVTGQVIYPHRPDLYQKEFLQCAPCDAYVGCHKDGTPLGRLADAELRKWKIAAHAAFDPIWQDGMMSRSDAYRWLHITLGMNKDACHIGMFDVRDCMRVVNICNVERMI